MGKNYIDETWFLVGITAVSDKFMKVDSWNLLILLFLFVKDECHTRTALR